jgi:hypothetical protein
MFPRYEYVIELAADQMQTTNCCVSLSLLSPGERGKRPTLKCRRPFLLKGANPGHDSAFLHTVYLSALEIDPKFLIAVLAQQTS